MDFSEKEIKILCKVISFYIKKFPIDNNDNVETFKKLIKKILIYRIEILFGRFRDV
jgi:hypothetical protein